MCILSKPSCWPALDVSIHEVCWAGVGPYTGNAIASIAGNQRVAVVDANVIRVLARLHKLTGDTKSKEATKQFAGLAQDLVDPDRPGCFNQVPAQCIPCMGNNMQYRYRPQGFMMATGILLSCYMLKACRGGELFLSTSSLTFCSSSTV